MVKSCMNNNNNNNLIKSSKKTLSWAKKLEDIKIISPSKKYLENRENLNNNEIIDKNNDYQDILKLKIKNLRIQIQDEIDIERKQYLQDKIDLYIAKINHNNYNIYNNNLTIIQENIFISYMTDKYKYKQMVMSLTMDMGVGMDMDIDMDIDTDTKIDTDIDTGIDKEKENEINTESFNIHIKHNFTCIKHKKHDSEISLSPPKYNCKDCKKRNICGHSNPHHCNNPFGYLYLVPMLCAECANMNKKCRWC